MLIFLPQALAALLLAMSPSTGGCADHPERVTSCRTVHGRLSFSNGAPSTRIWVVGTKRVLGVTGRMEASLPEYLLNQLTWDTFLYGDYWVCPLYKAPREGHMELVCIHTWRNLVREDFGGATPGVRRIPSGPAPEWPPSE
jgi:hypothetical protein